MLTRCLVPVALVASVLLSACPPPNEDVPDAGPGDDVDDDAGPGDDPDAGPGSDAFDVASFCDAFHSAVCEGFASCNCSLDGRAFDDDNCASSRAAVCEQGLAQAAPLVDNGDIAVDEVAADACLSAVSELVDDCNVIDASTLPASCAAFLIDDADVGEPCALSSLPVLCADGNGICNGNCIALAVEDEPCTAGLLCARGLTCDVLRGGVCVAELDEPALLGEGEACASTSQCTEGLACVEGFCGVNLARGDACGGPQCGNGDACVRDYDNRVCGERALLGQRCVATDVNACVGAFCDVDTCAPLPVESEACGPSLECAEPFLCDADNGFVCVLPPSEGEACLVGSALCAIGLGCNVDNICAVGPGVGEACLFPNNLCGDGLACDFTAEGSICVERKAEGEPCQNDVVCSAGLFCGNAGTCTPTLATGTACPTGGGCSEGDQCNDLGEGGFTCQPVPDVVDEPCLDECGEDLACTGLGGSCAPAICASP